jgi:dihydrofolate reductase
MESFDEAYEYCRKNDLKIIILGGEEVYREALKKKCRIFTIVEE